MTDPITVGHQVQDGYNGVITLDPDTGNITFTSNEFGDGGQPFTASFTPATPIGEVMDTIAMARSKIGI